MPSNQSFINANSASGPAVAVRAVNSANFQQTQLCDYNGNPHGSLPTYMWSIEPSSFAAGKHFAAVQVRSNAGKVMEITGIYPVNRADAAWVPTFGGRYDFFRTNSFTTVGSNWSFDSSSAYAVGGNITPYDTNNIDPRSYTLGTLYPSSMSVRHHLWTSYLISAASASQNPGYLQQFFNLVPEMPRSNQRLSFRPNEGLLIKGGPNVASSAIGFLITFTLEDLIT